MLAVALAVVAVVVVKVDKQVGLELRGKATLAEMVALVAMVAALAGVVVALTH
jgi:hypothetical protein